jgi:hypothetical protein
MKRFYLFLVAAMIISGAMGQFRYTKAPAKLVQKVEKAASCMPDPGGFISQVPVPGQKLAADIIGESVYDMQTYGCIEKRLYAYPDGSVAGIWTMAFTSPDFPERGAGYNYYDGSSWDPYPTVRVESVRTGSPCYAPLGTSGELIASHYQPEGLDWALLICTRTVKGEGSWTESTLSGPGGGVGIVWPDVVTNGANRQNIHILARTYGTAYNGQDGALLYYRSTDGGQTWDIVHHFFDDIGPNYLNTIDANGYAWAEPRGDYLAFSVGFLTQDGYVLKSSDNGETWTTITAFDSPYTPYAGEATPTFGAGDGTSAVAIDNDGKVHVAFGRMKHYYDETGTRYYYPATEGMIYWNENMPPLDTGIISSYTLDYLIQGGNLAGWMIPLLGDSSIVDFGSYQASLTTYPQINIDAANNIFLLWSAVAPGYTNGSKNFRHICGRTWMNGFGWHPIEDYNTDLAYLFSECAYPVMSPSFAGGNGYFLYQMDPEPGIHVWLSGHNPVTNQFEYRSVPLGFVVGTGGEVQTGTFGASQNFPNPFTDITTIQLTLPERAYVRSELTDISGRTLLRRDEGVLEAGRSRIVLERNGLTAGIYFCRISTASDEVTVKIAVE